MNNRNKTTCCCGTCQYWQGERKVMEKENLKNNEIRVYVSCEKKGNCSKKNIIKDNNNKCSIYYRWIEL